MMQNNIPPQLLQFKHSRKTYLLPFPYQVMFTGPRVRTGISVRGHILLHPLLCWPLVPPTSTACCEQCAVGKDPGQDIRNPVSLGHQHGCQCSPSSVSLEDTGN